MNIKYLYVSHRQRMIRLSFWRLSEQQSRQLSIVVLPIPLRLIIFTVLITCLAEPLTEEEVARKEELSRHGFDNWSKRDFQQFVKAVEAHGRCAQYTAITGCVYLLCLQGCIIRGISSRDSK